LPAHLTFENKSENANAYIWKVNSEVVAESENLDYTFLESGRYLVELEAQKDSKKDKKQTEIIIEASIQCHVLIKTSLGNLVVQLSEQTPRHLNNFVQLVESNYYNGLTFHRVIDGFMIQGGDNKTRKSGKRFSEPEQIDHEINPELHHVKGALAAARMPDQMNPKKKSSGSQFYIVKGSSLTKDKLKRIRAEKLFEYNQDQIASYLEQGGAPQLDGEYTVFGSLVSGFDVLDKISETKTNKFDKPLEDVKILNVKLLN